MLGRAASVTHDGETLTYQYDSADRLTGLVNNATSPPATVLSYTFGSGATTRRPSLAALPRTNCVQDFLYQSTSDDLRMWRARTLNATTSQRQGLTELEFTADGRVNSERDDVLWRYTYYNAARRVSFHSEYVNNGAGTYVQESGNWSYYDAWGNTTLIDRYQDWGSGWGWNVIEGRTFSVSDRLLTRAMGPSASPTHTLTHDARGRVTGDGEYTYAWDVRDRLTGVTRVSDSASWTFGYDATGRLTSMVEGAQTVTLRWRGWTLRSERIEESGETPIERVYRADGIDQGGEHLAMMRDVRGSVMGLTLAGDRVRTYRYGVWGEQTVTAPGSGLGVYDTHMGFTGHVVHRPTGLVFAPARVYSPRLRQWLTRDPLGERDAVDGRNLYAYVAGDPVNAVDRTGLHAGEEREMWGGHLDAIWEGPTNLWAYLVWHVIDSDSPNSYVDVQPWSEEESRGYSDYAIYVYNSGVPSGNQQAYTIGNVVFIRGEDPSYLLLKHEHQHIVQSQLLGWFFGPASLLGQGSSLLISTVQDRVNPGNRDQDLPGGDPLSRWNFMERGPYSDIVNPRPFTISCPR